MNLTPISLAYRRKLLNELRECTEVTDHLQMYKKAFAREPGSIATRTPVLVRLQVPPESKIVRPKMTIHETRRFLYDELDRVVTEAKHFDLSQDAFIDAVAPKIELLNNMLKNVEELFKCRVSRAYVASIAYIDFALISEPAPRFAESAYDNKTMYVVGEIAHPDDFTENTEICTNGIHCFMTSKEAIDYGMG